MSLCVVEPKLWQQPDISYRHYLFLQDYINVLNLQLKKYNAFSVTRMGDICEGLSELADTLNHFELWSHQETGNLCSYERDKLVARFTKAKQIMWHKVLNNGVICTMKSRDRWSAHSRRTMRKKCDVHMDSISFHSLP